MAALVSGLVWAALAVRVVVGTGQSEPVDRIVERVADASADDGSAEFVPRLVASVAPSVVALRARNPAGECVGSALVIGTGHVLTNAHLVEGADRINLTASDGRSFAARTAGSDPETDLAVLTVTDTGLVPAALTSSRGLRVGDMAVVVAARHRPQGSPSASTGVIAGLGQVMKVGGRPLYDVIATDAAVSPEASGGPLLDRDGGVVGITTRTAWANPADHSDGVAIPIDRARQVADQIIAQGRVAYPWLGLSGTDIESETALKYGVDRGALVGNVEPGGPAERGGLRVQDVITAVQAVPIATSDELTMLVRRHPPGDRIELTLVRSGTTRTVTVRLDRARDNAPAP